jgi:TolB-like protein
VTLSGGGCRPRNNQQPPEAALAAAVLPLENLSPDPANAFFAAGLRRILSAIRRRELQVVSGTTMRSYAGTRKPVKQIASELGASHLLAGAVRRAGEHVRLSLHLVDAATDTNVWSRTFDRQLRDALSLNRKLQQK